MLAALLGAQSQQQRVETCRKLIDGAYAGRLFYVLSDPMRVEAREPGIVRGSRVVLLRRDTIIEIILTTLASAREHLKSHQHRHRMRADLVIR